MSQKHTLEELRAMDVRLLNRLVSLLMKDEQIWPYCESLDRITAAVREWCGEDGTRRYGFVSALQAVIGEPFTDPIWSTFNCLTATPRDMSIALVLAAEKGAE